MEIKRLVSLQRNFFQTGKTLSYDFRERMLNKLYKLIKDNELLLEKALYKDLHKSFYESYETEIGIILAEITYFKKHLKKMMRPRHVSTPLHQFLSYGKIYMRPYGVVLNISPWNYPIQLALDTLVGSIASGNCTIIKVSSEASHTVQVLINLLNESFDSEYIYCLDGDKDLVQNLIQQNPDYIMFTGSSQTGKQIMKQAANHLIPVTLELGGKSPCIIDQTANLKLAAKRIVWGKFMNAGQTCIAPDYLLVQKQVVEPLISNIKVEIKNTFGDNPIKSSIYPHIINEVQFQKLKNSLSKTQLSKEIDVVGGLYDEKCNAIGPTIISNSDFNDPLMEEEIFGPILPIISFDNLEKIVNELQKMAAPLAMYVFSKDKKIIKYLFSSINCGGGCINDTISHFANNHLPFGGVGNSGMGNYHGINSFITLSHQQSVLNKSNLIDIPFKYLNHKNNFLLKYFLH